MKKVQLQHRYTTIKKTYSGEYGFENLLTNLQGEKFKKNEEISAY